MTRVLVVDDRLENLYLLRALLQGHGHTVDEARHGAEALVRARQTRPDLIISDLLMPVMDGYTLLRHWKADERLNTIPFVVYTATYTDPKDEQLALDLGADAFILKPAEPVSFMARIEAVIARDTSSPIAPPREPVGDEAGQLKEYNEVLVRKLEQKASELEQANLALRKDIARREQAEADLRRQADETTRARVALLGILEDQRQAEAALRVSEERFRLAASTGDVWDWNFETRKVSFPLDFWRRLGIDGPESANTAALFESILHPDDLARARQAVEDHIRLRLPYELEFRALAASGETRWFQTRGQAVWNERGRATRMAGTTFDITDRKRAEEALRKSETSLAEAQARANIGSWEFDIATQTGSWSAEMFRIFGRDPPLGMPSFSEFLEAVHADDRASFEQNFAQALAQGTAYQQDLRVVRPDGAVRWVDARSYVSLDPAGKPERLIGTTQDITKRKQTALALAASENRLRAIIDTEPECVKLVAADGSLLEMNPAGLRMIEADTFQQVDHHCIYPLVVEEHRQAFLELNENVFAGGSGVLEFEVVGLKGGRRWLETHASPLRDSVGQVSALLGITRDITARKQAEDLSRQSEERLRMVLDGLGPHMFVGLMDSRGVILLVNRPALQAAALEADEAVGKPVEDTYWWAYSETVRQRLRAAVIRAANGETVHYDEQIRVAENQLIWIDFSIQPLRDATGHVAFLIPSASVITARKQAEEALREGALRLQLAAKAGNVGLWDWDLLSNQVYYSPEWKAQIGYQDHEIPNDFAEWQSRVHPDDLARSLQAVQSYIEKPTPGYEIDFRFRHKDGSYRWILAQASLEFDAAGKPSRMRGSHVDITERKRIDVALQEREEQLRLYIEHAPAAIAMFDRDMRYLVVSQRWLTDYRLGDRPIIGCSHYAVFPEMSSHWKDIHQRCQAGAIVRREEDAFVRADGRIDWLRWEARPWRHAGGDIGGIIIFSEDITAHQLATQRLQENAVRLRTLSSKLIEAQETERAEIARELHDELGQGMTAVLLNLRSAERRIQEQEAASYISTSIEIANAVFRQVHDLALNLRPPQLDLVGLEATLREHVHRQAASATLQVHFNSNLGDSHRSPQIDIACFRIVQEAVTNVIRHAQAREIRVKVEHGETDIRLYIADDGIGFDVERTKSPASRRIGLLGMQERVELLGGTLTIVSAPGKGTEIGASIPLDVNGADRLMDGDDT